jgi:phosphate transport system permease protein
MSTVTDNKPNEPVVPNKLTAPKPIKPWKATPKQLLPDFLGAIGAVIASLLVVALSPMAGILGFVLTFIVIAIITAASISGIRQDRKAASNSV